MRILLLLLFAFLILVTLTKHGRRGPGNRLINHHRRRRHPCRTLKCRGSKPARKPPTLGQIAEKLDNNGKKINVILENVSDLKNTRSKHEYDYYEESGPGQSKLLSKKVDALLENVSELKTAVYNALNSSNVHEANEEKQSSTPSAQPTKNIPHQGIEGLATNQSGSGDYWDHETDYDYYGTEEYEYEEKDKV